MPKASTKGQIVGVYVDSSGLQHGFLDSGGTYTTLNNPSGTEGTVATGINDAGQIVGYYQDSTGTHGFLATPVVPAPTVTSDRAHVQLHGTLFVNAGHGVLANDTDPIPNDTPIVSEVNGQGMNVGHAVPGTFGTLTSNADGSYSYSARDTAAHDFNDLPRDGVGEDLHLHSQGRARRHHHHDVDDCRYPKRRNLSRGHRRHSVELASRS